MTDFNITTNIYFIMKNKLYWAVLMVMCMVAFNSCKKENPRVESMTMNKSSLALSPGQTEKLSVTVSPQNAKYDAIEWVSSNDAAATVDASGMVTAVAEGKAVITASIGNISASCEVNVGPLLPESVTLDKSALSLKKDETAQLVATVAPEGAKYELEWSSADPSVASVDKDGKVKGIDFGETVVTVKAGEVSAECRVSVVPVAVENVELDKKEAELLIGATVQLNATVTPSDATDKTLVWSSSDDKVATVADGLVTAVAEGTANITVTCGDKSDVCVVTVKIIPVESVTLSATSLTLEEGDSQKLTATVSPSDATYKDVTWSSDNESVATVDAEGNVTAVAAGTAVIKAAAGDVFAECNVEVIPPVQIKTDWELYEFFDVPGYGKGIVVEVGTDYIKVLSAEKAMLQWAIDPEATTDYYGTKTDKDGRLGTEALKRADEMYPGNYPAYSWCVGLGKGWYMPALGEIIDIMGSYQKRNSINAAYTAAGLSTQIEYAEKVWSNGEYDFSPETDAYMYYTNREKIDCDSKDVEHAVFAVLRIDFE